MKDQFLMVNENNITSIELYCYCYYFVIQILNLNDNVTESY
jgi:hypothetical protein